LTHEGSHAREYKMQVKFRCRYQERCIVAPTCYQVVVARLADENEVCRVQKPAE